MKFLIQKINSIFAIGTLCFLGMGIWVITILSVLPGSASVSQEVFIPKVHTISAVTNKGSIQTQALEEAMVGEKRIFVSLKDQLLVYAEGDRIIDEFNISGGRIGYPTPVGEFTILKKKPVVNYSGATYSYPNTKWNLMFKTGNPLNFYIHGAYWHNNFGHPMSGGCVNVAYANMEALYNWADVGTKLTITNDILDLRGLTWYESPVTHDYD